jgi:hypothetical protein
VHITFANVFKTRSEAGNEGKFNISSKSSTKLIKICLLSPSGPTEIHLRS